MKTAVNTAVIVPLTVATTIQFSGLASSQLLHLQGLQDSASLPHLLQ